MCKKYYQGRYVYTFVKIVSKNDTMSVVDGPNGYELEINQKIFPRYGIADGPNGYELEKNQQIIPRNSSILVLVSKLHLPWKMRSIKDLTGHWEIEKSYNESFCS